MNTGRQDSRELLAFYLDAGADALLGEEPVDRMADEIAPAPAGQRPDSEAVRVGGSTQRAPLVLDRAPLTPRRPLLTAKRDSTLLSRSGS